MQPHLSAQDMLTCCDYCGYLSRLYELLDTRIHFIFRFVYCHPAAINLIVSRFSEGCEGGVVIEAWQYMRYGGVVTGGNYNAETGCMPYTLPPCDHHSSGPYANCSTTLYPTPSCVPKCLPQYNATYIVCSIQFLMTCLN
jgi:hypothetical protein